MFEAQYLFSSDDVFTPWIPRGGDNLRFSAELVDSTGGDAKLDAFAYTKATDDEGNGTLVGGGRLTITSNGVGTKDWNGLGELVRFRIKNGDASPAAGHFILFRTLPPVWFDAVDAS